jgi:hypothetical protein
MSTIGSATSSSTCSRRLAVVTVTSDENCATDSVTANVAAPSAGTATSGCVASANPGNATRIV